MIRKKAVLLSFLKSKPLTKHKKVYSIRYYRHGQEAKSPPLVLAIDVIKVDLD